MTVQVPVLVWTVICFGALILILNHLLFKPMLAFMDRRAERIAKAAEKAAENRRALTEAEEELTRFREEEKRHCEALTEKALSDARREADELVNGAAQKNADRLLARREELSAEAERIGSALDEKTEELARAWLTSLTN